jgi:hypothetical protein
MTSLLDWLTMAGEWGIIAVIYLEIESTRLDHFFEDAFNETHRKAREEIYAAFLAMSQPSPEQFCESLKNNAELRNKCELEISLLTKIGNRLPLLPRQRRRVVSWFPHSVVFLWEILEPYVFERRRATGGYWANAFAQFARKSATFILDNGSDKITLVDTRPGYGRNYEVTRPRLELLSKDAGA